MATAEAPTATLDKRAGTALALAAVLSLAFVVSLVVRRTGSYITPLDGWGVDAFELSMGVMCILRFTSSSWRSATSVTRVFPLFVGVAAISWAVGDLATTIQGLGGATVPVPSVSDIFYTGFFPLCFVGFIVLVRGVRRGSAVATVLDCLTAGLGAAAVTAAFFFNSVLRVQGGHTAAATTLMIYPLGDLLLLVLALAALSFFPRGRRRFFVLASAAMVVNTVGDFYNLLQPDSKLGYMANGAAWPVSLTVLAIAVWVQPPLSVEESSEESGGFALPLVGTVAGLGLLVTASVGHVGRPAVGLATATLAVAGARLALTVREAQALKSARFRSLIDKAWDLIVVTEADLRIAFITPSAERVLGLSPVDAQGQVLTGFVHPDDVAVMEGQLRTLSGKASTETVVFETRLRHASGARRTVAWTATNLLGDPSVRGYVLNGADVTEARAAAGELVEARDAALTASLAKTQFLSAMSHEIRTPLNGVIGLTELLFETSLDENQLELASGVKVSAETLLVIVNDILDFSKIEAGRLELDESTISIPSILDDVGRILARTAHAKNLELLVDVQPDVPAAVVGDGTRIQQVLLNLGSNAVKFTAQGEVVIRASVLHENAERVALHFEVTDMGIGIAPDDQERLFQPFAQADASTTRRFGGTGLGLAISRQLVDLMGGKLGLSSTVGQGSTFWFDLSLGRTDRAPDLRTVGDPRSLAGQRALVVDDNATNRRILRQQLLSWRVKAVEAVDGYQALELVASAVEADTTFDFAIVDMNMPGMDGSDLAAALKSNPKSADITLFLLSSSGERLSPAEAHLGGFAASMTKPVRSSELFDCLLTSLNQDTVSAETVPATMERLEGDNAMGKVLLVEDNKMNQLVGTKVLRKLGYDFDVANNGKEAVEALRRGTYDAVLMDCQMPEMDGYEATGEIRLLEGKARHTPIIAMTASAMEGDRDACLAAGMDDFITKPVRSETVESVLRRWTASRTAGADDDEAPVEAKDVGPLDPEQIELLRSLDDDGQSLGEIVREFLLLSADSRGEILRVIDTCDIEGLARAAHTLKGASANVGASSLAQVCAELEARARDRSLDGTAQLVERFETELSRAREALNRLPTRV